MRLLIQVLQLFYAINNVAALKSGFISFKVPNFFWNQATTSSPSKTPLAEDKLLSLIKEESSGRGARLSLEKATEITDFIGVLEKAGQTNVINQAKKLSGCWKLLYTSSPGTNSPIQRSFTASDKVTIFQTINLNPEIDSGIRFLPEGLPEVSNVICFGQTGRLRITALASSVFVPLISPKKGNGKIFGLPIFGISSNRIPYDPAQRVDFAFRDACFEFKAVPLTIPYPVPFRLLGDEAKGYVDNTYISDRLRISRGNKGTIFVLERVDPATDPIAAFAIEPLNQQVSLPPISNDRNKNKAETVALIFPAQLGIEQDYDELAKTIIEQSEGKVSRTVTVPLTRLSWPIGLLPSFLSPDYLQSTLRPSKTLGFYLEAAQEAAYNSLQQSYPNTNVDFMLVGHSIGGWVARAFLSEYADPVIKNKIKKFVSLGTPHNPPPADSSLAKLDQTRGLLTYINDKYPGAYEAKTGVQYVSVAGTAVTGQKLSLKIEEFVAFVSYLFLAGKGDVGGDGIIPVETASLSGAKQIVVEGVQHSNYIPFIGKSIQLPAVKWYGSPVVVKQWLPTLLPSPQSAASSAFGKARSNSVSASQVKVGAAAAGVAVKR